MIYKFYTEGNMDSPFLGVHAQDLVTILRLKDPEKLEGEKFSYKDESYQIISITPANTTSPEKSEELLILCEKE